MLNVHASLLPKYRGSSPIITAIRNGDEETGVSIMRVRPKKFDIGEVLASRRIEISSEILMPELHEKLSNIGADLLIECIKDLNSFKPMEQDHSLASYAPKIDNEFCKVRWSTMSSIEVFNLYRSIYSLKNILTSFKNEQVKIIEILKPKEPVMDDESAFHKPGHLFFCKRTKKLFVKCADQNYLEIKQLSIGKKKAMSASDFKNGFLKNCKESECNFE